MGAEEMGRVLTEATLFNQYDLSGGSRVRCVVVSDAIVDEGVVSLALPEDVIARLGLSVRRTCAGIRTDAVRIEIMGRQTVGDADVLIEGESVYVGHITLTALGLKLDENGDLVDDPFPTRWWPLDAI